VSGIGDLKRNSGGRILGPLPENARIVFMGTPEFAVPGLEACLQEGHRVTAVVTQPDRRKGRGRSVVFSAVKEAALSAGIEVLQPEKVADEAFLERMRALDPDLLIVIAFGQVLKRPLLELPHCGAVNIHASLLPRYRGAAPIQWAVLDREKETGLTAMLMEEGLDSGPILMQSRIDIGGDETFGGLHDRLARLSGPFLAEVLRRLQTGTLEAVPQDEDRMTYAPKITKEHAAIRWEESAAAVSARIRAMDPSPGAFTLFKDLRLKLFEPYVLREEADEAPRPGRVLGYAEGRLLIEAGEGVLAVGALQMPGKRRMPAADFLRGFPIPQGTVLDSPL